MYVTCQFGRMEYIFHIQMNRDVSHIILGSATTTEYQRYARRVGRENRIAILKPNSPPISVHPSRQKAR